MATQKKDFGNQGSEVDQSQSGQQGYTKDTGQVEEKGGSMSTEDVRTDDLDQ